MTPMSMRRQLEAERGLTFVHPFDDPQIIAGQGTVALEMLEDVPDLDTLVVPIGGGGLFSGMADRRQGTEPRHRAWSGSRPNSIRRCMRR